MCRPLHSTFSFIWNISVRKNYNTQFTNRLLARWKSSGNSNSNNNINSQWQLMSAVCLERRPLLTQVPTDLEKRFSKLLEELEHEQSLKSDHEMRHQEDLVRAEQQKRGEFEDSEIDSSVMQTAQDVEDAGTEEVQQFKFANRITKADETNDQTSLQRALDRYLILVVRQKLGLDAKWVLPQGAWRPGETMRQTAERVLKTLCGEKIQAKFLGNSPCGFYKYKFPRQMWGEGKPTGAKVFFFKAQYVMGDLEPREGDIVEYKWLKQDEMKDIFRPSYFDAVSGFLIESKENVEENKSKSEINRIEN